MKVGLFHSLPAHARALVSLAVLLDGGEAAEYLKTSEADGQALAQAAQELMRLDLDVRLPFAGTMLRVALSELR